MSLRPGPRTSAGTTLEGFVPALAVSAHFRARKPPRQPFSPASTNLTQTPGLRVPGSSAPAKLAASAVPPGCSSVVGVNAGARETDAGAGFPAATETRAGQRSCVASPAPGALAFGRYLLWRLRRAWCVRRRSERAGWAAGAGERGPAGRWASSWQLQAVGTRRRGGGAGPGRTRAGSGLQSERKCPLAPGLFFSVDPESSKKKEVMKKGRWRQRFIFFLFLNVGNERQFIALLCSANKHVT